MFVCPCEQKPKQRANKITLLSLGQGACAGHTKVSFLGMVKFFVELITYCDSKKQHQNYVQFMLLFKAKGFLGVEEIPNMNLICDFRFLKIFKWANKINVCMCALKTCFVLFLWKNTDHSVYGQRNASFEKWWVMLLKFCEIDLLLDVKKQSIFKLQRIEKHWSESYLATFCFLTRVVGGF